MLWCQRISRFTVSRRRVGSAPRWMMRAFSTRIRSLPNSPETLEIVDRLLQSDPHEEREGAFFDQWSDDTTLGFVAGSQRAYIQSDESGTDIGVALVHGVEEDWFGRHKRPYFLDYFFTAPHARRQGHSLALLRHLTLHERLELTGILDQQGERVAKRAGFVQISTRKLQKIHPELQEIPILWRYSPPEVQLTTPKVLQVTSAMPPEQVDRLAREGITVQVVSLSTDDEPKTVEPLVNIKSKRGKSGKRKKRNKKKK